MKATYIYIIVGLILSFTSHAKNKIMNKSFTIPLVAGKNPIVQFETLIIEPTNLYIQPEPRDEHALYMQLELNVTDKDRQYSTFLKYYKINEDYKINNFPNAFGKYLFNLKIRNDNKVELVIEKSAFRKEFNLNLHEEATIKNLTIWYESCIIGWNIYPDGSMVNDDCIYHLLLSEYNDQQSFTFEPSDLKEENPLLFEWKNYKIKILYDSESFLKLKVYQ